MEGFFRRLEWLVERHANGKYKKFADLAGIPSGTFYKYKNERLPHPEHLSKFHDVFGVNIDWLITGEGNPYIEEGKAPPLNSALLREVIEVVELVLGKHGLVLEPHDKAEAVTVLYEMYLDSGKKPEEHTTERMLRLVA